MCLLSRCRSACRLPEASNAQMIRVRPCSSRRRISTGMRSTAPSTPPTCSAPFPLIETVWPIIVAVGRTMMGQTVSIRGNGAEHVGGVEGAVDRIAVEILHRLEQGRTLVIWAFDASGSLQAERQRLSKHIETIYTHITQLDENHLWANSVRHSFCLLPLPAHPKTSCKSDMFNIYLTCALLAPRAF